MLRPSRRTTAAIAFSFCMAHRWRPLRTVQQRVANCRWLAALVVVAGIRAMGTATVTTQQPHSITTPHQLTATPLRLIRHRRRQEQPLLS